MYIHAHKKTSTKNGCICKNVHTKYENTCKLITMHAYRVLFVHLINSILQIYRIHYKGIQIRSISWPTLMRKEARKQIYPNTYLYCFLLTWYANSKKGLNSNTVWKRQIIVRKLWNESVQFTTIYNGMPRELMKDQPTLKLFIIQLC